MPKPIDFEVSVPMTVDGTWSFRHNDERITYEQYLAIAEEHKKWVESLLVATAEEEQPVKRRKKK